MRIGVLSDVHGNLPALRVVLAELSARRLDGYIYAGDLMAGPNLDDTARLLRELKPWAIRGNSDASFVDYHRGTTPARAVNPLERVFMDWESAHCSEETIAFLESLPEQAVVRLRGTAPVRVVHGSPRNLRESVLPSCDPDTLDDILGGIPEPVLVCGHTHMPCVIRRNGKLLMNPGSVSNPSDGQVGAQYGILQWDGESWQPELHIAKVDLALVRQTYVDSGFLADAGPLARAFLLSVETGRSVTYALLHEHAGAFIRAAGYPDPSVAPDELWWQAVETFEWGDHSRR